MLNVRSVHWEPDGLPDEKMWAELAALLKDHPATLMVWEGQPLQGTVEKLKTLGLRSVVFDPCGNVPNSGDFLAVMRENIESLQFASARMAEPAASQVEWDIDVRDTEFGLGMAEVASASMY